MITRLLEAHYFTHRGNCTDEQVRFWLREMRTPELLIELSQHYPVPCAEFTAQRPLLTFAANGDESGLRKALHEEEVHERELDRQYWLPLKETLRKLRAANRSRGNI